jgi:hypothetical protein
MEFLKSGMLQNLGAITWNQFQILSYEPMLQYFQEEGRSDCSEVPAENTAFRDEMCCWLLLQDVTITRRGTQNNTLLLSLRFHSPGACMKAVAVRSSKSPPNRWHLHSTLHWFTSKKFKIFLSKAVRTSHFAYQYVIRTQCPAFC